MNLYRKAMVLAIVGLFIGSGVVPSIADTNETSYEQGNTITVDNEGDGDYTSIQDAIDISEPGDTILVYSGIYVENIVIDKQLNITGIDEELGSGDDIGKPVIDGNNNESVVKIISNECNISGFNITNSGNVAWSDAGILIQTNSNIIKNNILFNNQEGIFLKKCSNNCIQNNKFIYK